MLSMMTHRSSQPIYRPFGSLKFDASQELIIYDSTLGKGSTYALFHAFALFVPEADGLGYNPNPILEADQDEITEEDSERRRAKRIDKSEVAIFPEMDTQRENALKSWRARGNPPHADWFR